MDLDPDPLGSASILVGWIRILIRWSKTIKTYNEILYLKKRDFFNGKIFQYLVMKSLDRIRIVL